MINARIEKRKRAVKITKLLYQAYPDSKCSLNYNNAHELLVATILSAQCTDHRVNIVVNKLFKKYRNPEDFAHGDLAELSKDIHSCGYHNQKAKNIQGSSCSHIHISGRRTRRQILLRTWQLSSTLVVIN